ncbi:MAG: hypothetical protein ACOVLC_14050 [Flavobacterium sp.]
MDKSKQKKKYNTYNPTAIAALVKKYDVSAVFVRTCLRGERNSKTAIKIAEDYKTLSQEVQQFINNQ